MLALRIEATSRPEFRRAAFGQRAVYDRAALPLCVVRRGYIEPPLGAKKGHASW